MRQGRAARGRVSPLASPRVCPSAVRSRRGRATDGQTLAKVRRRRGTATPGACEQCATPAETGGVAPPRPAKAHRSGVATRMRPIFRLSRRRAARSARRSRRSRATAATGPRTVSDWCRSKNRRVVRRSPRAHAQVRNRCARVEWPQAVAPSAAKHDSAALRGSRSTGFPLVTHETAGANRHRRRAAGPPGRRRLRSPALARHDCRRRRLLLPVAARAAAGPRRAAAGCERRDAGAAVASSASRRAAGRQRLPARGAPAQAARSSTVRHRPGPPLAASRRRASGR